MTETTTLRICLRDPIPQIAGAARYLDEAVSAHLDKRFDLAEALIRRADMREIREWTESLWGPKTPHKKYRPIAMHRDERVPLRMPTAAEKSVTDITAILWDTCHTRNDSATNQSGLFKRAAWWRTNPSQHAAFQAMWVQYDRILPHARGDDNSLNDMVITCAPCNYGRGDYTPEEVGLIDPRTRGPVRSTWDGLERFRDLPAK